jgi:hypothetical protein
MLHAVKVQTFLPAGLARRTPILLLAIVGSLLLPLTSRAQEENRAGLIVVHGDGRIVQQCVTFLEESISGYELLQRGVDELSVEAGAMGATVCSIGGEGCSYPAESCFCRCQGSPCTYWSYWRMQPDGKWRYQPLGAGNTQVRDGDVEGWHWAEGTRQTAAEPPPARFEEICTAQEQAASAAVEAAELPATEMMQLETVQPVVASSSTTTGDVAGVGPGAQAMPGAGREPAELALGSLWVVLAAALVLPAAVLAGWALVRRKW